MLLDRGLRFTGFIFIPEYPLAGFSQRTKISLLNSAAGESFA